MIAKHLVTLELPKILDRLARACSFGASADLARTLHPTADMVEAQRRIAETSEARKALEAIDTLGIGGARDIRDLARRAGRGGMLEPSELLEIGDTLRSARNVQRSLAKHAELYPALFEITSLLNPLVELADDIARTIDDRGEVRDNASPALGRIRSAVRIAHERLMQKLQRMVSGESAQYLQEAIITQRSGRYVIPVKADFKGRIPGVVHDQSSSGMTLFIEPLAVLDLNNEWRGLQMEEEIEIQRILVAISGRVGAERDALVRNVAQLAQFDLALAKAKYGEESHAVAAQLLSGSEKSGAVFAIKQARHPLLPEERVVPIDILLEKGTRILVITGPNTGGKTVAMKTMGLFAAMTQCGLHVPAEQAELPVFSALYADIGDEQSIEQSLSTFSAHITNVVSFLSKVDGQSLVLMDELGSGTDPIEGAALARSILEYLLATGSVCVVATHYAELKSWAALTDGVANANVAFDVKTLRPLYKLTIGLPGRSNAFAIAQRLGMLSEILDAAQGHTAQDQLRSEDMLTRIAQLQRQTEAARDGARRAERAAEKNADHLRHRLKDIDQERRMVLEQARDEALREVESLRNEVRALRNRVTAAGGSSIADVREIEALVATVEDGTRKPADVRLPQENPNRTEPDRAIAPSTGPLPSGQVRPVVMAPQTKRRLQANDSVRVRSMGVEGTIAAVMGGEAEVLIGRLRTMVKLSDLERVRRAEPEPVHENKYERGFREDSPGMELDMRGMMTEEGIARIDDYLDKATRAALPWVRIIHGKGTGALRTAVRKAIKANPNVLTFENGEEGEGGDGVTVVKLRPE